MRKTLQKNTLTRPALTAFANSTYTDPRTVIKFETASDRGVTFGWALPMENDRNEFIGQLVSQVFAQYHPVDIQSAPRAPGYVGISIGGDMMNRLLFTAWESRKGIQSDLRFSK